MNLKERRIHYHLSQSQAAKQLEVPLRTYVRYENDENYGNHLKRAMMMNKLIEICEITEDRGLLTIDDIKHQVQIILDDQYTNRVEFCYLFGSYAKGKAQESSDVDLLVSTSLTGMDFVSLKQDLQTALHKRVDLIRFNTIGDNLDLLREIMHEGLRIYANKKGK